MFNSMMRKPDDEVMISSDSSANGSYTAGSIAASFVTGVRWLAKWAYYVAKEGTWVNRRGRCVKCTHQRCSDCYTKAIGFVETIGRPSGVAEVARN
eukprot:16212568-Heterocapsa_arctica.AAC.1